MLGKTTVRTISVTLLVFGLLAFVNALNDMQVFASKQSNQLKQIPSEPTDYPGSDPNAVKVDVSSANKDSIGNYHIRGAIKNLDNIDLEFVRVTGFFYDNDNQTVGVTSCCYSDPSNI